MTDLDFSSTEATMRLLDRARRYRRVEAACLYTAVASAFGIALALWQRHPITAVFAAMIVSAWATLMLLRRQMRREGRHHRASMIDLWERTETRRDAVLVLRDLVRETDNTARDAPGPADRLLAAVDEELAAVMARKAAEERLRALEALREVDAKAEQRRREGVERKRASAAEAHLARERFLRREFSDGAKQAAARVDKALLALEAKLVTRAADDADAQAFLHASGSLRAMLLLTPRSVVYEGRAPATSIGDDPAKLRQVVAEAQAGAIAGRVFESATAAASLKDVTRWAPFAQLGITADVLALFDPVIAGAAPVEPEELAPPSDESAKR